MSTNRSWWFAALSVRPAAVRAGHATVGYPTTRQRWVLVAVLMAALIAVLTGCQATTSERDGLRIVAGSGFSSFEPILKRWGQENGIAVQVTYKGSLDIMRMLEDGSIDADAIWEGDSMWTSLGDKQHVVKNGKSIMCSPIVFGIKKSQAAQLGWIGREVGMQEILDVAESRRLRVLMTSATQSNSGASAYFGFLYAFSAQPQVLTSANLTDPTVAGKLKRILATIDRTSESSGWMRDYCLAHYERCDAMFNYESHILEMNHQLVGQGLEPMYIVYPVEGLGIADFPFSLVSKGNEDKAPLVMKLQEYLTSEPVQEEIAAKGRRVGPLCDHVDPAIFQTEWGADAERTLNALRYPAEEVIRQALALYQTDFRKPSFTVYALDFSGSMRGKGQEQLTKAMQTLLDQQEASKVLMQGAPGDITIVLAFDDRLINGAEVGAWTVRGNDAGQLAELLHRIEGQPIGGGTDIYQPVARALELMRERGIGERFPAIILMTDGASNTGIGIDQVKQAREATGLTEVPVFGITFGSANTRQLEAIADLTRGRVFDGTKDLVSAFRKAKGNN